MSSYVSEVKATGDIVHELEVVGLSDIQTFINQVKEYLGSHDFHDAFVHKVYLKTNKATWHDGHGFVLDDTNVVSLQFFFVDTIASMLFTLKFMNAFKLNVGLLDALVVPKKLVKEA
jgi:hypothetical protein